MAHWFHRYKRLTDEALMSLIQQKEDAAFDVLFLRYSPVLQNFFFRRTGGDADLAADLTQNLFLSVWSNSHQCREPYAVRAWIFSIAYNLLKNHYRSAHYQEILTLEIESCYEMAVEDNTPLRIDDEILKNALQTELEHLNEAEQLLFELRFSEGLSVPEIAQIMNIPEGTVKSRLHTLTYKLRQKLTKYGNL